MDGSMDGSIDGSMDGSGPDGSVDSSMGDGGVEVFPGCTDTVFQEIDLGSDVRNLQQTVAVAPAAETFGLAWSDASDVFENIRVRVVPTRGGLGSNADLTTGFNTSEGAALLSTGTSFLAAYYDNSVAGAGYEVFVRPVDATGMPTGTAARLSNNMVRDDNPALLRMGSANLVVWVEDDTTDRVARAAIISDSGSIMGAVQTLTTPPESPATPVLSALSGGAGMAWAENRASGSDAVLLRVDTSAALVAGSKVVLSTEHDAAGAVDLATTDASGGAAVFDVSVSGVRPEVHFREVGADGSLPAPERIVSLAPATGKDASIAALAGGYVVAYRALPDGTITEPTLRLTLLDLRGEILNTFEGPTMAADGGRTTIRVAGDGRLLVAWEDQDAVAGGRRLRAARVRCAAEGPVVDGGMPTDGGMDAAVDGSSPDGGTGCTEIDMADPCPATGSCPLGTACLSNSCGIDRCLPAGHSCTTLDDCPAGSSCVGSPFGSVCARPGGGCADSRDCRLGFACVAGVCSDRRIPCDPFAACPAGYACLFNPGEPSFCLSIHLRCTNDGACGPGGVCADVDGDGQTECTTPESCTVNSDCGAGLVCGATPRGTCGEFGPCTSAADCPATFACQDLWGDGVKTCVPPGGTCTTTADCSGTSVCAVSLGGDPPACIP